MKNYDPPEGINKNYRIFLVSMLGMCYTAFPVIMWKIG